jgi:hypothetical protein
MSQNFGRAGMASPPLVPPSTAPAAFGNGPFSAVLRPSLSASQRRIYPSNLLLDCLVGLPDPDGFGAIPLVMEGHAAISVGLQSFRTGLLAVPHRVTFSAAAQKNVLALGLFDVEGLLWAWGTHRHSSIRPERPLALEFPAYQIMVRRLPVRIGT